jgi:sigma-B regulation protein RsbU (phosphoserine phosphatase)
VFFSRGERLGFDPKVEYEVKKFQLQLGDTIMLYTDGISEGKNAEGRQWGDRALKKTLGALAGKRVKQLKETVVSTFNQHTKGAVQEDDVTFLLLGWKGLQEMKKAA